MFPLAETAMSSPDRKGVETTTRWLSGSNGQQAVALRGKMSVPASSWSNPILGTH